MTGLRRPRAGRREQQRNQSGTALIGSSSIIRITIKRGDRYLLSPSFFINYDIL